MISIIFATFAITANIVAASGVEEFYPETTTEETRVSAYIDVAI